MGRKGHTRTVILVLTAVVVAVTLGPALHGCGQGSSPLSRVAEAIGLDPYSLSHAEARQVSRFNAAFGADRPDDSASPSLRQFRDAYKRVRAAYVFDVSAAALVDAAIDGLEKVDSSQADATSDQRLEGALDGMMTALDPHSAYFNAEELREAEVSTSGEFGGLGIQVSQDDGAIKVIAPIEDTPADRAGLKTGDVISHLDGESIAGMRLLDAVRLMRGQPGTDIRLTVEREGEQSFDVVITRAVIRIRPVRWRAIDEFGYIRVASFNERVSRGLGAAFENLAASIDGGPKGIVLDLRNNPGGLLEQALVLSDAFLADGPIVSVRGRNGSTDRSFDAGPGDPGEDLPVVVLVNGGSASASEIVASALQDQRRGVVMGGRSFGKGSVQTVMPLPMEGAIKLTTALYYAPLGRAIQARGVFPDIVLQGTVDDDRRLSREADLPGALPPADDNQRWSAPEVKGATCPEVTGEDDVAIRCAVSLLRAGSTDGFLAMVESERPS